MIEVPSAEAPPARTRSIVRGTGVPAMRGGGAWVRAEASGGGYCGAGVNPDTERRR